MKKRIYTFLFFTFMIWAAAITIWLLMAREDFPNAHIMVYIPLIIFGLSPALSGFLTEKMMPDFPGVRTWLVRQFDVRQPPLYYALVLILGMLYILPKLLIGQYETAYPLPYLLAAIPVALMAGGLEEIGWRGVLQKNLERRLHLVPAAIITAAVWWCWHLPLFYLGDSPMAGTDPLLYGIGTAALAFALAVLRQGTGSIWLCMLLHAFINALHFVYRVRETVWTAAVSGAVLFLGAALLLFIDHKAKRFMRER